MDDEPQPDAVVASAGDDGDRIRWAHPDEDAAGDEPPLPSWLETRDDDLGLGTAIVVPEPEAWVAAPAISRRSADADGYDEVDLGDDLFGDPVDDSVGDSVGDAVDEPVAARMVPLEDLPEDDEPDAPTEVAIDPTADAPSEGEGVLDGAPARTDDPAPVAARTLGDSQLTAESDGAGVDDDEEWDDDWDDDGWATEPATFASTVFASRPARITTVVAVVTIVVLLMSTVLLWQRLEDVKADVRTVPTQPVADSQLADLRRRLSRLETQVESTLDDTGNVVGPTEVLRNELAALRQCVAAFQQQLALGQRVAAVIC